MTPAPIPDSRRIFQFDQCFNDRKICEQCNHEGKVRVFRFPARLVDAADPEVLADLLPKGNPLVTIDKALPAEHPQPFATRIRGLSLFAFPQVSPIERFDLRTRQKSCILSSNDLIFGMNYRCEIRLSSSRNPASKCIIRRVAESAVTYRPLTPMTIGWSIFWQRFNKTLLLTGQSASDSR